MKLRILNLKILTLRKQINQIDITNTLLNMNIMLYYHVIYKIDKIFWLTLIYESKLIDLNDNQYPDIIYWEEANVISNKEFIMKWIIPQHNIKFEVKMTDEKAQLIQSDYLMAQLLSNNFKSLNVQICQRKLIDLLNFYSETVILRILKFIK